ncbi:non-ribosomal peptide synthetase [Sphaerisporangium siamense]|uniref:Amino acid adenylation domain-containing protein n=1 Tax=Sphaerisporangium siamense TaxID=795645 RepID=A0A7W7D4D6_9ACTN|nr:non-ribosomal peptide synthetase [Sphaerisporangium siamense]MBB4698571.1 amino acid adenylation domain-containing protein [Sphaerisporangium siamense]GII85369.1 non-ribosomal peptide synthetase [Sphaerisporangium siamense]
MKTGPLSRGQERLWFLNQLDPDDPSYNTVYAYRLRGELDIPALEAAFSAVTARHGALRTRFVQVDGRPAAVVDPPAPVTIEQVAAGSEDEARRIVRARTNTAFDLAERPPFRVTLVRLGPADHVLCVVLHHINGDGWSLNVLRTEVADHYAGRALPERLPPQYGDHVLARDDSADLDWWVSRLAGAPVLELPADRVRPARRGTEGGEVRFRIPPELAAKVAESARQARCTPYMVLLAAYQALLSRHSGQADFCVGTPSAGRDSTELEQMIGYLSTTMVLRCDLSGSPTFAELLRRTRRAVLDALTHRDVSFERLIGVLGVERDPSRTPLFQTMFALHTHGDVADPVPGLDAGPFPLGWHPARVDLSLDLYAEDDGGVLGVAIYSEELFDHETAELLTERYLVLLASAVADPSLPVGRLDLLTGRERARLAAWNDTAAELPPLTLVDLVLDQVAAAPGAVAVVSEDTPGIRRELTYRELAVRAGGLAARLRDQGAGPGSVVAVRMSRGPAMIVALLGVAMSGAAYLPVDPDYPEARVEYMIEHSGAALIVTDADLDDLLSGELPTGVAPVGGPSPDDTAYVLYTSGSTGRPKGVVVPHRALTNFLLAMRVLVGSQPSDVWLALTSLSFDISALELYLPLVTGGRVVVAGAETARDGAALARLIAGTGVTHVQATPSGWRVLLAGDLPPVVALAGGEPLPLALAAELRARVRRLVNMYGPTETTIWSTAWEVPERPERVSIGSPIVNTTVHVVDADGATVPIGVPGELLIGGAGVADGYLGRPDLTAERFVRHGGERVYRTGDVVRWSADGTLEFIGRTDNQVKLRGHRIELGEIEAVLEAHPAVRQAVVAVRDDLLVAFVVPDVPGILDVPDGSDALDLRRHVAGQLPGYMVPATVVALDALPLTPNGKVDRKALPHPQVARSAGVPPRTDAERLVAGVFAEVLGAADVRADDDFFALGGHSLLATMVTARLPVRIPVRELFTRSTVAALAELLDQTAAAGGTGDRAAAGDGGGPRPRPAGEPAPLSPGQERLWFLHRLDPDDASYNMWLVRRLRGPLDAEALERAVAALVARHESLRTRFPEADGAPVAVVEPPGPVPVEALQAADVAHAEALVAKRTNAPFDLASRPPLRVTLIRLSPDDHVLCVVLHHIAGDGWSLNVMLDELGRLYSGERLDPVPLQFGDIARWQRARNQDELVAYWGERLAGAPRLDLPTDRPHTSPPARKGGFHTFRLPAEDVARLAAQGRERGATLFMTLLTAYQAVLAAQSGQSDITIATVASGRDWVEAEKTVGYLADVLLIRADPSATGPAATDRPSLGESLERTRDAVLSAFEHQGIPFERLRVPAFETMAILHNQDTGTTPAAFSGLVAEPFAHGFAQVKFDLMLEAWQDERELLVVLSYDAALFDHGTIEAMAARLEGVLRQDFAAPPRLTTAADEARLLELGRGPDVAAEPYVPELVALAVRAGRDSCAVDDLTYGELDARAGELAALLQTRGAGPGDVVGVRLGRTPDSIAALLAVWRTGAAYLPLDPGLPGERLAFMLGDSAAALVLTSGDLAGELPPGVPVAYTSQAVSGSAPEPVPVTGDAAAYVIYTSGSTGTPKGVVVEHRNLAARVAWMVREYGLGPGDLVVQFASLGFDTHAEEIYPTLAAGARLALLPDGAVTLTDHLDGVTVLDLPTAYWHHLVDQIDSIAWPPELRLVILGGEQVHEAAVRRWRARFGDRVRLVNTYGPTEATIIATIAELDGSPGRPPIGRPIGGTRVHILDAAGRLAPRGAAGELCVGGAGVARGYLGRTELTAERFVDSCGERVYRTGDRARWRPDGQLEFLGRLDAQVKVRGFRIEPGEIEARLLAHPEVGEAAVVAIGDTLAGYVTGSADFTELAEFAGAALPPYMVPTAWARLDRLPLTRSGKIDRAALPTPQAHREEYVAPGTDAEELVAEVFGEILGVEKAGVHDDFFSLGGHSLLAVRIVARLRDATGLELPIRTLFTHPTVGGLARAVEELLIAELDQMSDEEAERLAKELR